MKKDIEYQLSNVPKIVQFVMGEDYFVDAKNLDYTALYERLSELLSKEQQLEDLQEEVEVVKRFFQGFNNVHG